MTRDAKNAVRQQAIDRLRQMLKPGDTLYTQVKHVSRSGMSRVIQVVKIDCQSTNAEPSISYLGYTVAQVLDWKYDRNHEGVKVSGCGMDMGFHLVYELSHALFKGGFGCIGEGCPSNDHSNGDRDYTPYVDDTPQNSSEVGTDIPSKRAHRHYHSDPGYALKQHWI